MLPGDTSFCTLPSDPKTSFQDALQAHFQPHCSHLYRMGIPFLSWPSVCTLPLAVGEGWFMNREPVQPAVSTLLCNPSNCQMLLEQSAPLRSPGEGVGGGQQVNRQTALGIITVAACALYLCTRFSN